jgi:hypothetical protein
VPSAHDRQVRRLALHLHEDTQRRAHLLAVIQGAVLLAAQRRDGIRQDARVKLAQAQIAQRGLIAPDQCPAALAGLEGPGRRNDRDKGHAAFVIER